MTTARERQRTIFNFVLLRNGRVPEVVIGCCFLRICGRAFATGFARLVRQNDSTQPAKVPRLWLSGIRTRILSPAGPPPMSLVAQTPSQNPNEDFHD